MQSQQDLTLPELEDAGNPTKDEPAKKKGNSKRPRSPERVAVELSTSGKNKNEVEKMFEKFGIKVDSYDEPKNTNATATVEVVKDSKKDGKEVDINLSPSHLYNEKSKLLDEVPDLLDNTDNHRSTAKSIDKNASSDGNKERRSSRTKDEKSKSRSKENKEKSSHDKEKSRHNKEKKKSDRERNVVKESKTSGDAWPVMSDVPPVTVVAPDVSKLETKHADSSSRKKSDVESKRLSSTVYVFDASELAGESYTEDVVAATDDADVKAVVTTQPVSSEIDWNLPSIGSVS